MGHTIEFIRLMRSSNAIEFHPIGEQHKMEVGLGLSKSRGYIWNCSNMLFYYSELSLSLRCWDPIPIPTPIFKFFLVGGMAAFCTTIPPPFFSYYLTRKCQSLGCSIATGIFTSPPNVGQIRFFYPLLFMVFFFLHFISLLIYHLMHQIYC